MTVYKAVEQYLAAVEKIHAEDSKVHHDKLKATRAEMADNPAERRAIWGRYYAAVDKLDEEFRARVAAASQGLWKGLEAESDPLIKWLHENTWEEYPNHTLDVLKALPASVDELTILALRGNWCNVFDNFVRQARQAGALPPLLAREELEKWFAWRCFTRDTTPFKEFTDLLDKVIEEVKAEAAKSAATE